MYHPSRRLWLLVLVCALVLPLFVVGQRAAAVTAWQPAASMDATRVGHTLTRLRDGRILAVGGHVDNSAELYDPATDAWTATGPLANPRSGHTATLLDDGTVLVAGGFGSGVNEAAERYDPESGHWSPAGNLTRARFLHSATLLEDGSVLIFAGNGDTATLASFERYDPIANEWTFIPNTIEARFKHTASLLPDGTVLIAGGEVGAGTALGARIWDPAAEAWGASPSGFLTRWSHTATTLNDGRILIAGGISDSDTTGHVQIYDPATGTFGSPADRLNTSRAQHTATLLPDGSVLVAGGVQNTTPTTAAEIYLPATDTWLLTGSLIEARFGHAAELLPDGGVLVAGGQNTQQLATAERFPGNTPPVMLPPRQTLRLGTLRQLTVPVTISYPLAVDPDGVARYNLRRRTNGGEFQPVALPTPTTATLVEFLLPGRTYQYQVRATDQRGAASQFVFGLQRALVVANEEDGAITYTGDWTPLTNDAAFGGGLRRTATAGRHATYTFTGRNVGWVTSKGPGQGRAEIWLDGTKVRTIDLYAPTSRFRQLVFAWNDLPNTQHTLQIRVLGTKNSVATGARVDVDAFVVLR